MRIALSLSVLVLCLLLAACSKSQAPAASGPSSPAAVGAPSASTQDVKAPGDANVGDKTTCPVMKHAFVVTETSPSYQYEGKTYYFCCPGCIERFKADPKKYLN